MIAYDFSNDSQRVRSGYYNLLSPAGKAHLASLLRKEREVAKNFVFMYETKELRMLAQKASRGPVTPEEQQLLDNSPKSFKGKLASGYLLENKKAIEVIEAYLNCLDIVDSDSEFLVGSSSDVSSSNTEIILGNPVSYWNLHPSRLPVDIFRSLFTSPEYTRGEIEKLINLKLGVNADLNETKIFHKTADAEAILLDYHGTPMEKKILVDKLMELQVIGDVSPAEYRDRLAKIVDTLLKRDAEFDIDVYNDVKDVLPQYHNKKTKYFIYMLSQFNYSQKVPISSRIDIVSLYAFYRKAEELCSY